jgi:hypothetical protein
MPATLPRYLPCDGIVPPDTACPRLLGHKGDHRLLRFGGRTPAIETATFGEPIPADMTGSEAFLWSPADGSDRPACRWCLAYIPVPGLCDPCRDAYDRGDRCPSCGQAGDACSDGFEPHDTWGGNLLGSDEPLTLGPCQCIDYHMADCPLVTGEDLSIADLIADDDFIEPEDDDA